MFSLSKWSGLFKSSANSTTVEVSATCTHDISDEWICVDDAENCELINIDEHEVLDEATKARRQKWQKRLLKGRSQRHNSLPSKAKMRKSSQKASPSSSQPKNNITNSTSSTNASSHQIALRAKLKLAVEAAATANHEETNASAAVPTSPPKARKAKRTSFKNQSVAKNVTSRYIQQPCQRGMN